MGSSYDHPGNTNEACCDRHRSGDTRAKCRDWPTVEVGALLLHRNARGRGLPWKVREIDGGIVIMDRGQNTRWEVMGSVLDSYVMARRGGDDE